MKPARIASALSTALIVASPFVFYFVVTRARLKEGALFIVVFVVLRTIPTLVASKREHLVAALRLPIVAALTAIVGVVTDEPRVLLALPSLSQMAFGLVFLASLRTTPLVEHFARMTQPELDAEHLRYTRTVTVIWGIVLVLAGIAGLVLAGIASIEVWTVYTGIGAYVVVAVVFSIEYVVRKIRFREYGSMPIDRLIARLFPAATHELHLGAGGDKGCDDIEVLVPREYVFFKGHFPTRPMLPGIAQITEMVLPIARRRHPDVGPVVNLKRVRFKRPIFPGETVIVSVGPLEHGPEKQPSVQFFLRVGKAPVANGTITFRGAAQSP